MLAGVTAGIVSLVMKVETRECSMSLKTEVLLSLCTPLNKQFTVDLKHIVSCLPPHRSVASVNWIFLFFTVIHSDVLIRLSPFQLFYQIYTKISPIYFKQTLYQDKVAVI